MKRAQIQLDQDMWERVRARAFQEKRSISAIVREALQKEMGQGDMGRTNKKTFSFIASGVSTGKGAGSIAEEHDEALAEAF